MTHKINFYIYVVLNLQILKILRCCCKLKNCSNGNCNCKKKGNHCGSHCTCNKKEVKI